MKYYSTNKNAETATLHEAVVKGLAPDKGLYMPEIINKLILTEAFDLISLPERYNYDFEELQKISNKGKIELTVNPICNPFCPYFSLCLGEENNNQYNFSSKSAFSHCAKRKPYLQASAISLAEIEEKYLPLGINHFKISSMT